MSLLTHTHATKWLDAQGNPVAKATQVINAPCSVALDGILPVAAGTAQGTEIDLPMLGIVQAATFVTVQNQTGQELEMAWGGNWLPNIPPGGLLRWAFPVAPSANVITSLRFMLTQEQGAAGSILYTVCGS